ncbi:hypothetical protein GCM10010149_87850 [Nonomuraea roseoviolacea subsp. roseoviolacea]|uniref:hypothetical protein n=1 Tax=Nonomuraea roseoviolacea TaxID=103837 RepID=UPI0031DE07DF
MLMKLFGALTCIVAVFCLVCAILSAVEGSREAAILLGAVTFLAGIGGWIFLFLGDVVK